MSLTSRSSSEHRSDAKPILFYDGHCALCHGAVRFVLAKDHEALFRFAPLQSTSFAEIVADPNTIESLPDSLVLYEGPSSEILVESDAVARLLFLLGGAWRVLGTLLRVVPRWLRNFGYRVVARHRKQWFGTTDTVCPMMPAEYRSRFDL